MTEYKCSVCEYKSLTKQHVAKHILRKKSCGIGIKQIIEVSVELKCKFCKKFFSSQLSLDRHSCKIKDNLQNNRIKELELELEIELVKIKNATVSRHLPTRKPINKNTIRNLARQHYKKAFKLECVHCKNNNLLYNGRHMIKKDVS